jgi:glucuronosyltransferase
MHLELQTLTEDKLRSTILEMVKPIYKENILKFRELVNDQPVTSREKAVWWTEYVLRHKGAKHLAYPGRLVPFYQKYCLDFVAIALSAVTLLFISMTAMIRKLSQTLSLGKKKSD